MWRGQGRKHSMRDDISEYASLPTSVFSAGFYLHSKIPFWKQFDQDLVSCKILFTKYQKKSLKDIPDEFFDPLSDDMDVCISATL